VVGGEPDGGVCDAAHKIKSLAAPDGACRKSVVFPESFEKYDARMRELAAGVR
jgi:hypothetical protein